MSSVNINIGEIKDFSSRFIEACGTSEPVRIQRLLDISNQAVRNYLNGRLPDARVLITIAERTPYSIHWLLTGTGKKLVDTPAHEDTPLLARQISALIKQEVAGAVSEILGQQHKAQPRTIVLKAADIKSEAVKDQSKIFTD
jgi:hypothetical protein